MKNDPVEAKLRALAGLDPATGEGVQQLAKALADRSNQVVKKAARLTGEAKLLALLPDLRGAFDRFMLKEPDKNCAALTALSAALIELEYDEAEPFLSGIRHVQKEPVFGGHVDVAADLRANCAVGLVNMRHPRVLEMLVTLLADKEWRARAGAVRALAAHGSDAAALLLRYKALVGDAEREVLLDCFSALLQLDDANIGFVAARMQSEELDTVEAAILALGGSRSEEAFDALCKKLAAPGIGPLRRTALIAIASMRLESALAFVKKLAEEEDQEAVKVLRDLRLA